MSGGQGPGVLDKVVATLGVFAREIELAILSRRRLRAIEDRLAALDGGDDAARAIRAAAIAESATRMTSGEPALSFHFQSSAGSTVVFGAGTGQKRTVDL